MVVNPLLASVSPVRDRMFAQLARLSADMVRFVPWFPYPLRAVPELRPQQWNFTYFDEELARFLNATRGRRSVINFSTQPAWLYNSSRPFFYCTDPNMACNYDVTAPVIPANIPRVAEYYARLAAYLT